jgi:general stress protein YciG
MATKGSKGDMSVREAGRKGGEKGGQTTRERYGTPFYREIGRKGGETVRSERGHEFYEEIGKKGGQRVRDLIAAAKREAGQSEKDETEE